MKETTLQRLKRLNAEAKHGRIEGNDDWWKEACKSIIFSCEELLSCSPSDLSDFELGGALGAYAVGWTVKKRKEKQND
jgi:hypothetical protein